MNRSVKARSATSRYFMITTDSGPNQPRRGRTGCNVPSSRIDKAGSAPSGGFRPYTENPLQFTHLLSITVLMPRQPDTDPYDAPKETGQSAE